MNRGERVWREWEAAGTVAAARAATTSTAMRIFMGIDSLALAREALGIDLRVDLHFRDGPFLGRLAAHCAAHLEGELHAVSIAPVVEEHRVVHHYRHLLLRLLDLLFHLGLCLLP